MVRRKQAARFEGEPFDSAQGRHIFTNGEMKNSHIKKYAKLTREAELILTRAGLQYQLSARSYMKLIKISRTIADLADAEQIEKTHALEALQYRPKAYELD